MKKGKKTPIMASKSITQFRSNLFKEMIDKQQTAILKTREGKFFVKKNHFILGTYLPFDSTDTQCYNEFYRPSHYISFRKYTDPTISMYAIIMKKPIFLESLLDIQHELFQCKKNFNKIIEQGLRKVNILDLSIESYSDECLDVILKFFDKHDIKYDLTKYFYYAFLHKNGYAFEIFSNKLNDQKVSIKQLFKNNDEYQHFLNLNIPFNRKYKSKTVNEYLKSLNINVPPKIPDDIVNKDYQNLLNIIIPVRVFSSIGMSDYLAGKGLINTNQQTENENESNPVSSVSSNSTSQESNQDTQSNIIEQDTKRCIIRECNADMAKLCPKCKKYFCDEHYEGHACS